MQMFSGKLCRFCLNERVQNRRPHIQLPEALVGVFPQSSLVYFQQTARNAVQRPGIGSLQERLSTGVKSIVLCQPFVDKIGRALCGRVESEM